MPWNPRPARSLYAKQIAPGIPKRVLRMRSINYDRLAADPATCGRAESDCRDTAGPHELPRRRAFPPALRRVHEKQRGATTRDDER